MTAKIDSSEVLFYLNEYGIRSIDEDAFKQFMKDLKKLIKHEQRKKETSEFVSPSSYQNENIEASKKCNCDIRISSCCPEKCATVTYVHCPCTTNVCNDAETSENKEIFSKNSTRCTSSLSHATTRYKNRRKRVNDPVQLYHYYQSIWKQHKLPGENDHSDLRQAIRNKLMNR